MNIEDCDGKVVSKGSIVKILQIDTGLLNSLPDEERSFVESMVDDEFVVEETTDGFAIVSKEWKLDDGRTLYHSISLSKNEMKLV